MPKDTYNSKRIAKNTLMLYVRMLFIMAVNLYASRVVLASLGVEDYGIYSVVGGIVIILSFLNGAMAGATQRFLNVEMGRGTEETITRVFNTARVIHLLISLGVLLLAETVGLWYINKCMNISPERMTAANWVFQFSTLTFIVNVISVPYNATIVAHERMSAFAYISIYETVAKLAVAFSLAFIHSDRLIAYGALLMLMQVSVRLVYGAYCNRHFGECRRLTLRVDKALLREMFSFASWTVVGSLGFIFHTQGIALLINYFFGAVVNAAQGIANQVNNTVNQFVSNFLMAMNPQVVKSYAVGELEQMHQLVFRGCRFAFFLISFFVIPLTLEAPAILGLWLKTVPGYTVIFVRLVLLISLVNCYSSILAASQGATGRVKAYQLTLTVTGFLHLPLTALFYWLGFEPYYAMYVYFVIVVVLQATRIAFVSRSTHFPQMRFYREVVLLCLVVFLVSAVVPALLHLLLTPCLLSSAIVCLTSVVTTGLTALCIGMTRTERTKVLSNISKRLKRR
ncbi:MAG: oligosaccharide flippase family protein [Prevotellaceae bacterium]|nr:oligosaccharide flippase family protein [Prevotellaceae bacterium]